MFSFRKKIDSNLRICLNSKYYSSHQVLIKYKNFKDSILKKISSYKGELISCVDSCCLICARLNSRGIRRLIEYPEVEYICFDEYLFLCGMSVPTANKVKLSNKISYTGKDIGIGLIDSGVYPHPDLVTPFNRIETFIDLVNGFKFPYDDNGHGTATAGIICGNGSSSNNMYCGVASESKLHCYKAFDKLGKGFVSKVLLALERLILTSDEHNIKIICMPFELLRYDDFIVQCFYKLFELAVLNNIIIVVPSGSNQNIDGSITGFANSPNCLTISGINTKNQLKPYKFSSAGIIKKSVKPDFCAACCDIVSLNSNVLYISEKNGVKQYAKKLDVSYRSFSGTSLATAYVSGLCALLFEQNNNYTFKDIKSLLTLGSEEICDIEKNIQGLGRININKILK